MKDFNKYSDEELSFFFLKGLSTHRRYHNIDTENAFLELALNRPKAFRNIFSQLDGWRQIELFNDIKDDVAKLIIKKFKSRGE